ncbi:membrane fusion protein, cobalt-zinc-cadmium efflux system [Methylomagnum ishizawai]|uniref:Membrane fusion protein, cobalt-zinc-cadmium efflux system n=1 Tax=Methylomagnum ishizawai TaxID=1760988 RepID=A0A1Y6D356_9GAMM|nr:efflux RND transporter periplasmic adaptor subunit [Methylomagnum ishizawai]SMF97026.1 membrane fusion protein, cobalt-zinc-cadmium efflux system [Methylomagnum ishizawai]
MSIVKRVGFGGVLPLWLGLVVPAYALDNSVRLTPEQISHLGIRAVPPEAVAALPLAQAPGRVVLPPAKEFVVSALQAGVITHVNVPLGVKVGKGQVLAQLRSATLLDAQRNLIDAVSEYELARAKLDRDQTLLQEGVISKLRWQETKGAFDKAQAALGEAEQILIASGVGPAEVARLKAKHQLDSAMDVRSPIDGVVLERMAVVGQRLDAMAPLFRIGQLDELWLEVDMPQERLREVKLGDRIVVENPKAAARIIEVSQNVDAQSQSALVRAVVDQGAENLRPGMNLNVQLMHRSTDRIFRVPVAAVISHEGKNYVFVKTAEGYAAREVAVAGQEAYSVTVHEGLEPGDAVAVQGVAGLKAAWLGMGEGE